MDGTTSAASRSRSPASSETSVAHVGPPKTDEATPAPRHSVAAHPEASARRSDLPAGALTCEWDDCGARFGDVPGLVAHLENGHIGVHKSSYTCEWASCPRRGLVQTSRFALVSHCRSHTGEKPFVCSVPECDKSFTRSDTLAKHLRQQHNIATPTPVRGGYRKRKRSMTPPLPPPPLPVPPPPERHVSHSPPPLLPPAPGEAYAPSHYNFANRAYAQFHDPRDSGFNTFRVNPAIHDRPAPSVSSTMRLQAEGLVDRPPREEYLLPEQREEEVASSSEEEDGGKPYNAEAMGGRSKAMVKYLIMKAKYRYIMDERGLLMDQLDALKREEKEEWREKEASVDRILRGFGPDSERLIRTPDIPTNGKRSRGPVSLSPQEDPGAVTEGHPPSHPSHPRHDHRMEVDAR